MFPIVTDDEKQYVHFKYSLSQRNENALFLWASLKCWPLFLADEHIHMPPQQQQQQSSKEKPGTHAQNLDAWSKGAGSRPCPVRTAFCQKMGRMSGGQVGAQWGEGSVLGE